MVFDPDAARARNAKESCNGCDAADAMCAAYRHALKDVARGEPEDAKLTAMLALDDDSMYRLGQLFHKIVKAGVQLVQAGPTSAEAFYKLQFAVEQLVKDSGATVKGWTSEKI